MRKHADDGYHALGRYFAEFSQLTYTLRSLMVDRLHQHDDPYELAELPFGGMTAEPMVSVFFAMCRLLTEHDPDEEKAATRLRVVILEQIALRNIFAHGDWRIGWWTVTGGKETSIEAVPPEVERITPGKRAGTRKVLSEDLEAHADELVRLRMLVGHYGVVCLRMPGLPHPHGHRVRDVLVLVDSEVTFGPGVTQPVPN
jgi:hypothetical protein